MCPVWFVLIWFYLCVKMWTNSFPPGRSHLDIWAGKRIILKYYPCFKHKAGWHLFVELSIILHVLKHLDGNHSVKGILKLLRIDLTKLVSRDARRLSTIQFSWVVFWKFLNIWTLQVYQWDLCNIASDDIEVGKSSLPSLLLDIFSLLVRVGQSFDSAAWEPEQRQHVKAQSLMNLCRREEKSSHASWVIKSTWLPWRGQQSPIHNRGQGGPFHPLVTLTKLKVHASMFSGASEEKK